MQRSLSKAKGVARDRQHERPDRSAFLPTTLQDMRERGWNQADFVYVCGDAYVDHPSFGMAIITRLLEAKGYRVGVIAQPDWRDPGSIVPRSPHEKALQRALIRYRNPKNRDLVREALRRANRRDLIGYGPSCLVRPEKKRPSGRERPARARR